MKTFLREKNEKLIIRNKEWTENEKKWIKHKVASEKNIEELKKKNEDKKHLIDELKARHDAEKKAIFQNQSEDCKKMKKELEDFKQRHQIALNEITKLASFVNIFGENVIIGINYRGVTLETNT